MRVVIIEKSTNRVVAIVPEAFRGVNYAPADSEWFDQAWEAAVEDKLVNASQRVRYSFDFKSNLNQPDHEYQQAKKEI